MEMIEAFIMPPTYKRNLSIAFIFTLLFTVAVVALKKAYHQNYFVNPSEYSTYLESDNSSIIARLQDEVDFWEEKIAHHPGQYPYLGKMATVSEKLFKQSGDVSWLNKSVDLRKIVAEAEGNKNAATLQGLAHALISQHEFQQALEVLFLAEALGTDIDVTHLMLSDVYLEIGDVSTSYRYLELTEDKVDPFHYMIRKAKLADHEGDLDRAIELLERSLSNIAEDDHELQYWAWSNLGDFYGHAGRIEDSYDAYLLALDHQPAEVYPLYGIAWIQYSHLGNYEEAGRMLDVLRKRSDNPTYFEWKAQIAEMEGKVSDQKIYAQRHYNEVSNDKYGDMYLPHIVEYRLSRGDDHSSIIKDVYAEVEERPTAQSHMLLAWTLFHNDQLSDALAIVDKQVYGQCYEPGVIYKMAEIYKEGGRKNQVAILKKELSDAIYELGPTMEPKIDRL